MTMRLGIGSGALLSLCLVTPVRAEEGGVPKEGRLRLSGSFAGTAGQWGSEAAYGASLGYRFSRRFAMDVELTGIPDAAGSLGRIGGMGDGRATPTRMVGPSRGPMAPGTGRQPTTGRLPVTGRVPTPAVTGFGRAESEALLGTANLRAEFRADNERVRPYLTGGFGIARVESEVEAFEVSETPANVDPRQRPDGRGFFVGPGDGVNGVPVPLGRAGLQTQTDLALVVGGGLSVRLVKGLFVDADARFFRLLDPGRNVGRFGGGLSYRF
jgi:opacity protein-like surface antigen